jgi:5-dehydro-2-deoxygluconokinase
MMLADRTAPGGLRIFSIDHGADDLGSLAEKHGANPALIATFKALVVCATANVAAGRPGFGMFLEGDAGREALSHAADHKLWVARQFPHDREDAFFANPSEWPTAQVVKVIADKRAGVRTPLATRLAEIDRVAAAVAAQGRELLIEALSGGSTADLVGELYALGLDPDWWLVEPQRDTAGWHKLGDVVRQAGARCKDFIAIVREASEAADIFKIAVTERLVRGFVGGRALFGATLEAWLQRQIDDAAALDQLTRNFANVATMWDSATRGRS